MPATGLRFAWRARSWPISRHSTERAWPTSGSGQPWATAWPAPPCSVR